MKIATPVLGLFGPLSTEEGKEMRSPKKNFAALSMAGLLAALLTITGIGIAFLFLGADPTSGEPQPLVSIDKFGGSAIALGIFAFLVAPLVNFWRGNALVSGLFFLGILLATAFLALVLYQTWIFSYFLIDDGSGTDAIIRWAGYTFLVSAFFSHAAFLFKRFQRGIASFFVFGTLLSSGALVGFLIAGIAGLGFSSTTENISVALFATAVVGTIAVLLLKLFTFLWEEN